MSDVERYWEALSKKWGRPVPPFNALHPAHQMAVIQSVNIMLSVLDEVSQ